MLRTILAGCLVLLALWQVASAKESADPSSPVPSVQYEINITGYIDGKLVNESQVYILEGFEAVISSENSTIIQGDYPGLADSELRIINHLFKILPGNPIQAQPKPDLTPEQMEALADSCDIEFENIRFQLYSNELETIEVEIWRNPPANCWSTTKVDKQDLEWEYLGCFSVSL